MKKSSRLNWVTQFLMVAYDGAYSCNVCQNGVNFLWCLTLPEKKLDDSSCLHVVEIAQVA